MSALTYRHAMRFLGPGGVLVQFGSTDKGLTKRSPRDESALRVRIMNGRHVRDAYQRGVDEIGDRARELGPIDMSSNALAARVEARNVAHMTPPWVEALSPVLAGLIGDQSAVTTIARYALTGGRPMPTRQVDTAAEVLGYRIGANFAATLIGWSEKTRRPYLHVVSPDDLEVEYRSDDPIAPTITMRRCMRRIGGRDVEAWDTWDLTDLNAPTYRVLVDGVDKTVEALGERYDGPAYWWRYAGGRPFCPVVIIGNPREPYRGLEVVDASLTVCALWTHCKAGFLDAAYPSRHAIGLREYAATVNAATGQTGQPSGPEIVHRWEHDDPEKPGSLQQFGPGFDPEAMGRFVRSYEARLVSALPIPLQVENTGGEPAETEAAALREAAQRYYRDARGHDSLVLRRVAAICNRASELTEGMVPFGLPEVAPAILYREEIAELKPPTPPKPEPDDETPDADDGEE